MTSDIVTDIFTLFYLKEDDIQMLLVLIYLKKELIDVCPWGEMRECFSLASS